MSLLFSGMRVSLASYHTHLSVQPFIQIIIPSPGTFTNHPTKSSDLDFHLTLCSPLSFPTLKCFILLNPMIHLSSYPSVRPSIQLPFFSWFHFPFITPLFHPSVQLFTHKAIDALLGTDRQTPTTKHLSKNPYYQTSCHLIFNPANKHHLHIDDFPCPRPTIHPTIHQEPPKRCTHFPEGPKTLDICGPHFWPALKPRHARDG